MYKRRCKKYLFSYKKVVSASQAGTTHDEPNEGNVDDVVITVADGEAPKAK